MFGVASPAGIINLVTKRAGEIDVTSIAAAGNSFGQYGGSFDIGRRFGAEREVGVRINASQAHTENGIRETGGQSKFANLGFDYKINDRLSVQGDYENIPRIPIAQSGGSPPPGGKRLVPIPPDAKTSH